MRIAPTARRRQGKPRGATAAVVAGRSPNSPAQAGLKRVELVAQGLTPSCNKLFGSWAMPKKQPPLQGGCFTFSGTTHEG